MVKDKIKKKETKPIDNKSLINKLDELINKVSTQVIEAPKIVVPDNLLNFPTKLDEVFNKNINILNQTDKYLHQKQMDYYSFNTKLMDSQFSEIIQRFQSLMNSFSSAIKDSIPTNIPPIHDDYITREESVTSSKSIVIDVNAELGRIGRYGFIASDSGTITVRLNEKNKTTLMVNDVLDFDVEQNFRISKVRIETTASTNDYRLFIA